MQEKILLLHGWGGSDFPHWQSWLAGEIAKEYGTVSFPKIHDSEFPNKDDWMLQAKKHLKDFQPDIVIAHSLATTLWFHLCNEGAIREVKKLYLVAPPSLQCEIQELQTFFPLTPPKNLYAQEVLLITSTTDPYMTPQEAKELQNALGIEMKVLESAGHINADSNYGEWPWMLHEITNT